MATSSSRTPAPARPYAWTLLDRWLPPDSVGLRCTTRRSIAAGLVVAERVSQVEITQRAAALTYHTVLALVPLLSVGFALFKAFGGLQRWQGPLEDLIVRNLAVGRAEDFQRWMRVTVDNVNGGALAGVSVLLLFYSAAGLLTTADEAFNRIWKVQITRPLYLRLAIYWCVLTLAPPVVGFSLSLSTSVVASTVSAWFGSAAGKVCLALAFWLAGGLMFFVIYVMVPNTRVPKKDALISALAAALAWNVAKFVFFWTSAKSSSYSAIYGALAALPLLLLWLYSSWVIVLLGVAYTAARRDARESEAAARTPVRLSATMAGRVLAAVYQQFQRGSPITIESLHRESDVPVPMVAAAIEQFIAAGVMGRADEIHDKGGEVEYLPRRDPGAFTLEALLEMLRDPHALRIETSMPSTPVGDEITRRLLEARSAERASLKGATIGDVVAAAYPAATDSRASASRSTASQVQLPPAP